MRVQSTGIKMILTGSMLTMLVCMIGTAAAEDSTPLSLKMVPVPQPTGGDIMDQDAAVRLGKALYWDMQTGGDGMIACATCHFHAGADNRVQNTINPGPDGKFQTADDIGGSQGIVGAKFVKI